MPGVATSPFALYLVQTGVAAFAAVVLALLHRQLPGVGGAARWSQAWTFLALASAGTLAAAWLGTRLPPGHVYRVAALAVATTFGFAWVAAAACAAYRLIAFRATPPRNEWLVIGAAAVLGLALAIALPPARGARPLSSTAAGAILGLAIVGAAVATWRLAAGRRTLGAALTAGALAVLGAAQVAGLTVLPLAPAVPAARASLAAAVGLCAQLALLLAAVVWLMQEEQRRAVEGVVQLDTLTGLPRRRLFLDRLRTAVARAREGDERLAVFFLDLDKFKSINDSLGHAAGDQLLQTVATRVRKAVRSDFTVTRVGGDEFTVLAPRMRDTAEVMVAAQEVRSAIKQPMSVAGHELRIGTSIGVSIFPDDGEDPETLLKHADAALYGAKEAGRDLVQLCTPALRAAATEQALLEAALRRAITADELEVHYQPIVDAASGRVTSVEALLRWHHPDRGTLAPPDFLHAAESIGLLPEIGDRVLHTAAAQLADWRRRHPELRLAVNASLRELQSPNFAGAVAKLLRELDLPANALELEVTELGGARGGDAALEALGELRRAGVRLSIDDFGTGYSSLEALALLAPDALKIDASFVRDIDCSSTGAPIPAAIVALAHALGVRVIAEGVEREEQLRCLLDLGCDAWQGALFGRPSAAAECSAALARQWPGSNGTRTPRTSAPTTVEGDGQQPGAARGGAVC
jgi:diguanylate cyclase (GGDEF)-like protein